MASQVRAWEGRLNVVVSSPPLYSFVKQVGGDRVVVLCLSQDDAEKNVESVKQADLLLAVGLGLDDSMANAARAESKVKYLKLGEHRLVKVQVRSEGDQYLWLGVKGSTALVLAIGEELGRADPGGATTYSENARKYAARLTTLYEEYSKKLRGRRVLSVRGKLQYLDLHLSVPSEVALGNKLKDGKFQDVSDAELNGLLVQVKSEAIQVLIANPEYSAEVADLLQTRFIEKDIRTALAEFDVLDKAAPGELDADWFEKAMRKNLERLAR